MTFFAELKRRNVFKVGATYAVLAWVLMQVADIVLPTFNAPSWILQVFLFFLLLGFPVALIVSWAFELTPEGLKPTAEVDPAGSIRNQTSQKLNHIIIAGLALVLVLVLINQNLPQATPAATASLDTTDTVPEEGNTPALESATASTASTTALSTSAKPDTDIIPDSLAVLAEVSDKTIAVLPFDDFNAGGDEEYFADGLTEEILNTLARTPDLLVASRTSSFQYKNQNVDIRQAASALGVAHVLEGSVRQTPTRIRITAQLIRASDGFHLWSETYDRQLDDIIAVQEDIAFQIATALKTAMDPVALREMLQAGTRSVTAYKALLQGLAIQRNLGGIPRAAYDAFEEARRADPGFAAAHYYASMYWYGQLHPFVPGGDEGLTIAEELALFHERMDAAVASSSPPDQYFYQAQQARVKLQGRAALAYLRQYMQARPNGYFTESAQLTTPLNLAAALGNRAMVDDLIAAKMALPTYNSKDALDIDGAYRTLHAWDVEREFMREALNRFPDDGSLMEFAHRLFLFWGETEEARALLDRMNQIGFQPGPLTPLRQACADQNLPEANRLFDVVSQNPSETNLWGALHLMNRTEEAVATLRPLDTEATLFVLWLWNGSATFDSGEYPNLLNMLAREGIPRTPYQPEPFRCNR